jgi:hypothetical protein
MGVSGGGGGGSVPRSLMFITPAALELALRCLGPSLGGLDERPWTAESTLVREMAAGSADMIACLDGWSFLLKSHEWNRKMEMD